MLFFVKKILGLWKLPAVPHLHTPFKFFCFPFTWTAKSFYYTSKLWPDCESLCCRFYNWFSDINGCIRGKDPQDIRWQKKFWNFDLITTYTWESISSIDFARYAISIEFHRSSMFCRFSCLTPEMAQNLLWRCLWFVCLLQYWNASIYFRTLIVIIQNQLVMQVCLEMHGKITSIAKHWKLNKEPSVLKLSTRKHKLFWWTFL